MSNLHERIDRARELIVIEVELVRGRGSKEDIIRRVLQYWSRDGELLAERDDWKPK